jgi:hypothetical protein
MRAWGVPLETEATQSRGSRLSLMVSPCFRNVLQKFWSLPSYRRRRMRCMAQLLTHSLSANRKIQSIASVLRLSDIVSLAATRLYTLAVEHKFTKGRKSLNVIAVCLYVACRQKETRNYMLIDFSDLLQVKPHHSASWINPLIFLGQRIRARTHVSPTCSDAQSTVTPSRSFPLYLSLRRALRVWR